MTRASVLIPIHDKPGTLPLAVETVLRQSVTDLEVILIGDGVTDAVRAVARDLVARDDRVRLLDLPKGPHHGERYRHDAILAADSDAIFYLCDDDLLLPDHVADLLGLLEDHDLVQSLNGYVTADGAVRLYPGDLADPASQAAMVSERYRFNFVSITGTAHTRSSYLALDDRWDTTPDGWPPDHWQFAKLVRRPGFCGATSRRMTALQFPTSADDRHTWSDEARLAEILPWHELVLGPGAQERIDRLVAAGSVDQLTEEHLAAHRLAIRLEEMSQDLHRTDAELDVERRKNVELDARASESAVELHEARAQLEALRREEGDLQVHLARLWEIRAEQAAIIERLRARLARKRARISRLRARVEARE